MKPNVEKKAKLKCFKVSMYNNLYISPSGNKPFQVVFPKVDLIYLTKAYMPTAFSNCSNLLTNINCLGTL